MSTSVAKPPPARSQQEKDNINLKLIYVFHYALAALTAAKALLGIPLVLIGLPGLDGQNPQHTESSRLIAEIVVELVGDPTFDEPALMGAILVMSGATTITLSLVHGGALAYIGWCVAKRKRRLLTVIFSWFDLMYLPFGTLLSLYVIYYLRQPSIMAQYETTPESSS